MEYLFEIGVTNALLALFLAIIAWLVTRVWKHPALVHILWVLVLIKLITPPLVNIPIHDAIFSRADHNSFATTEIDPQISERATLNVIGDANAPNESTDSNKSLMLSGSETEVSDSATLMQRAIEHWKLLTIMVWLKGSAIWLLIVTSRLIRFHWALRSTAPCSDHINAEANRLTKMLGVTCRFQLRMTDAHVSPLVWPLGRMTIVLSRPLLAELSDEEIQTLLAHELAHIRRKDHWVRWLELAVSALYWWHPVVWWARRMIHNAEEKVCDAWVLSAFPAGAKRYGSALLKTIQFVSECRTRVPFVASRIGSTSNFKERIEDIMNATWNCRIAPRGRFLIAIVALSFLPLSLQGISNAEDKTPVAKQATKTKEPKSDKKPTENKAGKGALDIHITDPKDAQMFIKMKDEPQAAEGSRQAELDAIREHIQFLKESFKKVNALYQAKSKGGEADKRAFAGYELATAESKLALTQGNREEAIKSAEKAQTFAEVAFKAVDSAYKSGTVTFDLLLQASRNLSDSKVRLIRIRRGVSASLPEFDTDRAPRDR